MLFVYYLEEMFFSAFFSVLKRRNEFDTFNVSFLHTVYDSDYISYSSYARTVETNEH